MGEKVFYVETWYLTEDHKRQYEEVGIILGSAGPLKMINGELGKKYFQLSFDPSEEALQRFLRLPLHLIEHLERIFPLKNPICQKLGNLIRQKILANQLIRRKDGMPIDQETPFTLELEEQIPPENRRLRKELERYGIEKVLVGLEMEFSLNEEVWFNNPKWLERKREITNELTKQIEKSDGTEKEALIKKRHAIKEFNAREILMYDLIECNSQTRGFFEPVFGESNDKNSYYDGINCFELKFLPVDSQTLEQRRRTVVNAIYDQATEWGMEVAKVPTYHVNLSFWKNGQNLFDDQHPEFSTTGKKILEGITRMLYDAMPFPSASIKGAAENFDLTVTREKCARFATGRYEINIISVVPADQHPAFITTAAIAGAVWGLTADRSQLDPLNTIAEAQEVQNPTIHYNAEQFKVISHVLSNSIVEESGKLRIPENYILEKSWDIGYRLGIDEEPYETMFSKLLGRGSGRYARQLVDFFEQVTISKNENGYQINWPMNEDGNYVLVIPEKNMDKIPPEVQQRIRKGEKISHEEMGLYISGGQEIPCAEERLAFDVQLLANSMKCTDIRKAFIIESNYDYRLPLSFPKAKNKEMSFQEANAMRMLRSRGLRETLSPEFFAHFVSLVERRFGVSAQNDSLAAHLRASPAKPKWWHWGK